MPVHILVITGVIVVLGILYWMRLSYWEKQGGSKKPPDTPDNQ